MGAITREVTEFTELTDFYDSTFDRRGRIVDVIIGVGFAIVIAIQLYMNFGPKPGDYEKKAGFIGPPRPNWLARR